MRRNAGSMGMPHSASHISRSSSGVWAPLGLVVPLEGRSSLAENGSLSVTSLNLARSMTRERTVLHCIATARVLVSSHSSTSAGLTASSDTSVHLGATWHLHVLSNCCLALALISPLSRRRSAHGTQWRSCACPTVGTWRSRECSTSSAALLALASAREPWTVSHMRR